MLAGKPWCSKMGVETVGAQVALERASVLNQTGSVRRESIRTGETVHSVSLGSQHPHVWYG